MDFDFFQAIGFLGMALVVWAYWLIQSRKTTYDSFTYLYLNLVGAILLIISLMVHFNLGSFMIEVFWIGISGYGLLQRYKKGRK